VAGFTDETYVAAGARVADDVPPRWATPDLVLCVQPPSPSTLAQLKQGAALVGTLAPQADAARGEAIGARPTGGLPA
jgi:NAD(P) transhydrogenase subunit alpha